MKAGFITLAFMMLIASPVFADEAHYVTYKIKIDKDENFENQLKKNEQFLKQLKGTNLFSNWTQNGQQIPDNASEMYKKPSLRDDIVEGNQETDYIKCERGTVTK